MTWDRNWVNGSDQCSCIFCIFNSKSFISSGICWNYKSQRTNYLFSWKLLRIACRDKKWSKFGQLQTLCCQKVYYDSGLQASKPLLGPVAVLGESTLTRANGKIRSAAWSHRTIAGIFLPIEMYRFLSVFQRLFLRISWMKPYVQFIQLYWLGCWFGAIKQANTEQAMTFYTLHFPF